MGLEVVILAAGKGTRMYSNLPKVLHKIANKEILYHVIEQAQKMNPEKIHIVYGYQGELVKNTIKGDFDWCEQKEQLGTGHAVKMALPNCNLQNKILILLSDMPLIRAEELQKLVNSIEKEGIGVLTAKVDNPFGLGRIKRDSENKILKIVEQKDCTDEEKLINEINTGVIVADGKNLSFLLEQVKNENNQKEFYLTDIIQLANQNKINVTSSQALNPKECEGINNKYQLALSERLYQERKAQEYMLQGLSILDYKRVDFRGSLEFGKDCTLDTNVIINGKVVLGNNVYIGSGCVLTDCTIADNTVLSPYTIIDNSEIGQNNTLGPFARLRPGCSFGNNVHVGNFVEVKKSQLGEGTKAGHLSYLGDSEIGKNVNIGAGTITCNYDGANKWKTKIGDDVFVGSDTQIVAPVTIENGVTIGAGTTVTKDVQENNLVITRAPLKKIENWIRPTKKK